MNKKIKYSLILIFLFLIIVTLSIKFYCTKVTSLVQRLRTTISKNFLQQQLFLQKIETISTKIKCLNLSNLNIKHLEPNVFNHPTF